MLEGLIVEGLVEITETYRIVHTLIPFQEYIDAFQFYLYSCSSCLAHYAFSIRRTNTHDTSMSKTTTLQFLELFLCPYEETNRPPTFARRAVLTSVNTKPLMRQRIMVRDLIC
ncbi:unnamed protein product [Somion occarium]|uniref:Uncharacterized protein n=1 Tax=Somion occarium TaxID=3059160 RepID=A0ABP1DHJ3_9APHY